MTRRRITFTIAAAMAAALTWAAAEAAAQEPTEEAPPNEVPSVGASPDDVLSGDAPPAEVASDEAPPDEALSGDMVGELRQIVTAYEDNLLDLARANSLGYTEMIAANQGVDPWVPGEDTPIVLPTGHILPDAERQGIVVNLAEHRLYYFGPKGGEPVTFPLGVGKEGWSTPLGTTEIVRKKENPAWYPPESIRAEKPHLPKVVPAGPHNPLGSHALYFDWPSYLIHGTNMPWGVGRRVSHGCIRLYPEDIARLFELVPVGTPVQVIEQAIKVGWSDGALYLEAHPEAGQADELERTGKIWSLGADSLADVLYRIKARAGAAQDRLDWRLIRKTLKERSGVPVQITLDRSQIPG